MTDQTAPTLTAEIARLRKALVLYGDRARMSNAPADLQQSIDDAFAAADRPTKARAIAGCMETKWTCFHCGETFTDERCARTHFGAGEDAESACRIKAGAEGSILTALRRAEEDAAKAWCALHNETSDFQRAYYAQTSRHNQQLQAAEELGFERGIAGRAEEVATLTARFAELEGADKVVRQIEERFPNWIYHSDLIDCIDCTLDYHRRAAATIKGNTGGDSDRRLMKDIFRETPGGSLEVFDNGSWKHVPDAAAARIRAMSWNFDMSDTPLTMEYRNWRGETSIRRVIPINVYFGSTEWHPEPQWLMTALDMNKGQSRDFALKDTNFSKEHAP